LESTWDENEVGASEQEIARNNPREVRGESAMQQESRLTKLGKTVVGVLDSVSEGVRKSHAELFVSNAGVITTFAVVQCGMSIHTVEAVAAASAALTTTFSYLSRRHPRADGPLRRRKRLAINLPTSIQHWLDACDLVDRSSGPLSGLFGRTSGRLQKDVMVQGFYRYRFSGFAILNEHLKVIAVVEVWPIVWFKLESVLAGRAAASDIRVADLHAERLKVEHCLLRITIPGTTPMGISGMSERDLMVLRAALFGLGELSKYAYLGDRPRRSVRLFMLADGRMAQTAQQIGFEPDSQLSGERRDRKLVLTRCFCEKTIFRYYSDWDFSEADANVSLTKPNVA
jgi:hypothetical protein